MAATDDDVIGRNALVTISGLDAGDSRAESVVIVVVVVGCCCWDLLHCSIALKNVYGS